MKKLGYKMNELALRRLRRLVKPWGGEIRLLSEEAYYKLDTASPRRSGFSPAPFGCYCGVHYRDRAVILGAPLREHLVAEVIHEMGHVFASRKSPDASEEFDFLGWEMATARHVGLPWAAWRRGSKNYQLWDIRREERWPAEVGACSYAELALVYADRVAHAIKLGLVSETHRPLCVRV